MTTLEHSLLEKNIRSRIDLLGEISNSWALTAEERSNVNRLQNEFKNRIENIKHLRLGVIGEFNSGKSTLINSILKTNIVATNSRPCTPVPVYIKPGQVEKLKLVYEDLSTKVAKLSDYELFTTEGEGSKGVKHIVATVNSTLLKINKIILIDTPGINAVNPLHTVATLKSLKNMHAAILLIYSKQPGAKSTVEFLQQAADQVHKIFVCVSKADFLAQDQLDRIIKVLPARLKKDSGVNIDKVWPIQFTENGRDEGLTDFIEEIRKFMVGEWYEIISKDLQKEMNRYSNKVKDLLSNTLYLQEKVLSEFTNSKPTEFSKVAEKIKDDAKKLIHKEFSFDNLNDPIKTESNRCMDKIRTMLFKLLRPKDKTLIIFDKRITENEVRHAYTTSMSIFEELLKYHYNFQGKMNQYAVKMQYMAEKHLASMLNSLDKLDQIVFRKKKEDPRIVQNAQEIVKQEKLRELKKWLILPALTLLFSIIIFITFYKFNLIAISVSLFLNILSLIPPAYYYFQPRDIEIIIDELAKQEIKNIPVHAKFTFPKFNNYLLNEEINNSDIFQENETYFHAIIRQCSRYKKFDYFKKPYARVVYKAFVEKWESNIKLYEESMEKQINENCGRLWEHIKLPIEKYIASLNKNYSFVMDDVFKSNMELSQNLEEKIRPLRDYIFRLDDLNNIKLGYKLPRDL